MKNFTHLFFSGLFLIICQYVSAQQTYINKDWEHVEGIPGQYDYVACKLHPNGNFIYVGNNTTGGQSDILVTCIGIDGSTVWQQTNGTLSQNDYGTDIAIDNSGNIYVCGSVSNGSNLDYRLIKYTSTGTLIWTKQYNGTGNGDDVPVAIRLDASGNIYITGSSNGLGTFTDYATLKYNSSGTLLWTKRYNYTNLPEIATSMEIDNSGNIFVAGASANNLNNSDFCIVKYNSAGTQVAVQRHATTGNGYDLPSEMAINSSGNIYLLGTSQSGSNKNIKLLALSNSLAIQWAQYIDQYGQDDEGYGLTLTPTNNILITGYSKKANGGTNLVLAKYFPTGTQAWLKNKTALIDNQIAKGRKVRTNSSGRIYISGEADINGTRNFVTQSYDDNGNLLLEKVSENTNSSEKAAQLIVANNDVFVTGTTNDGSTTKFATVKYSIKDKPHSIAGSGDSLWNAHELIIDFDSSSVIRSTIDKVEYEAGTLIDFVKPQVITQMNQKTGISWEKVPTFRIFRKMTTADSLSITRLGDTIHMPTFWSALSVIIPSDFNEQRIADSLNKLSPKVHFAERNFLSAVEFANSNDPLLTAEQSSLIPTLLYDSANININPAWDIETGRDYIKVGVFDDPIYWAHEDFGDGTFSGSKIKGGWDYHTNSDISNVTDPTYSHGTACAGIIGALRNNSKGIAGIAGGDVLSGNSGVLLYSFGIFYNLNDTNFFVGMADVADAIVNGSASTTTGYGYGLHVQNHSWGSWQSDTLFEKAIISCWQNNCTYVAARGNRIGMASPTIYPPCYKDEMLLSVGASGTTGLKKEWNDNFGDWWFESFDAGSGISYVYAMDFVAPGVTEVVSTTIDHAYPFNFSNGCTSSLYPNYQCFIGTSAAAPHVSGVAALMHSRHNIINGYQNNLAPEDVEQILQRTADNREYPGATFTTKNAWGLIDAGKALEMINTPIYRVYHSGNPISRTILPESIFDSVFVVNNAFNSLTSFTAPLGTKYRAQRYRVTLNYQDVFNSTEHGIAYWARLNATTGLKYDPANITGEPWFLFNSPVFSQNTFTVNAITYCWHIIADMAGNPMDQWIPLPPGELKVAYSVHVMDTALTSIKINEDNFNINIFPNPTTDALFVEFNSSKSLKGNIEIYDVTGKVQMSKKFNNVFGNNYIINLNVEQLNSGIYFCKVLTDEKVIVKSFVKQKK
ncbi:MAG: S8 family serine peptidase [Bacteroidia bacterium]|nr:S8 family serine peptidase [Bacteroidia bacterium]